MFEKEAEDSFKCKKVLHKWETDKHSYIDGFKDGAMNEAKGIIKDLLHCLPKENIEGVYEVTEAAEQFLRGGEE